MVYYTFFIPETVTVRIYVISYINLNIHCSIKGQTSCTLLYKVYLTSEHRQPRLLSWTRCGDSVPRAVLDANVSPVLKYSAYCIPYCWNHWRYSKYSKSLNSSISNFQGSAAYSPLCSQLIICNFDHWCLLLFFHICPICKSGSRYPQFV